MFGNDGFETGVAPDTSLRCTRVRFEQLDETGLVLSTQGTSVCVAPLPTIGFGIWQMTDLMVAAVCLNIRPDGPVCAWLNAVEPEDEWHLQMLSVQSSVLLAVQVESQSKQEVRIVSRIKPLARIALDNKRLMQPWASRSFADARVHIQKQQNWHACIWWSGHP